MVGLVRLLRPFLRIRVAPLVSERIGHYAGNTEIYLCERDAGMHGESDFDIFYHREKVCNQQLKKMWSRTFRTFPYNKIFDTFLYLNHMLPGGDAHRIHTSDRDVRGLIGRTKPHLTFLPEERALGEMGMREMGIPEKRPFICFLARTSSYLNAVQPELNWDYHNYRNSSIHNYICAVESLVQRGYSAVRMGAVNEEPLEIDNPNIIDYSNKCRTELLDLYLASQCRFSIAGSTGFEMVPCVFRRPRAIVNQIPLIHIPYWNPHDLIIFKKLWLCKERRFLSCREIIHSAVGDFQKNYEYEQAGIEVIENTAEEIEALAIEMDGRLNGNWLAKEEDEELQRDFWALLDHIEPGKKSCFAGRG
jgi:putative glycosyltransferase (TIGR04372 family)